MAVAGRLHIFINADVTKFTAGMKAIEKHGRRLEGVGRGLAAALTVPIAAAATAIGVAAVQTARYAANIDDAAHRTGLSTTAVQELQYAAGQLGTSFEDVEGVVGAFVRRIPQIEQGSGGAADAMQQLGVELRDSAGNLRPMGDLLRDTMVALGNMENETARNALSTQIFGRRALEIAPMLAAGGAEIERLTSRAHELGLVMGPEKIAELAAFDDQMEEVRDQAGAAGREFALSLLPAVKSVLDVIQDSGIPLIKGIGDRLRDLSPDTLRWALALGGVAAVAGPLIYTVGVLTRAVAALNLSLMAGGWIGLAAIALGGLAAAFLKNKLDAAAAANAADDYAAAIEGIAGAEQMRRVMTLMDRQAELQRQSALPLVTPAQSRAIAAEYLLIEDQIRELTAEFNRLQAASGNVPDPRFDLDRKPEDLMDLRETVMMAEMELAARQKIADLAMKERDTASLDPKGPAVEAMSKGLEQTEARYASLMSTAEHWSGFVANQFSGLVTGAMTVKDAFKNMVGAVIGWLGQLLAKLIAVQIVTAIIGGVTGGAGGGFTAGLTKLGTKVPSFSTLSVPAGASSGPSPSASSGGGLMPIDWSGFPRPASPQEAARTQESISLFAAQYRQHFAMGG